MDIKYVPSSNRYMRSFVETRKIGLGKTEFETRLCRLPRRHLIRVNMCNQKLEGGQFAGGYAAIVRSFRFLSYSSLDEKNWYCFQEIWCYPANVPYEQSLLSNHLCLSCNCCGTKPKTKSDSVKAKTIIITFRLYPGFCHKISSDLVQST